MHCSQRRLLRRGLVSCVYYQLKCPYEKSLETYCVLLVYIHTHPYIYIYIYIYIHTHTYTHTPTYIYVYIYAHAHIYMYPRTHIYLSTHTHIYIFIHTHIYIYIHIYLSTHTHTHTYIYLSTHTHIYIYTYIFIHTAHTHTHIYIYTYIFIHTHNIYIYTYIFIHIYIDPHIQIYAYIFIHTYKGILKICQPNKGNCIFFLKVKETLETMCQIYSTEVWLRRIATMFLGNKSISSWSNLELFNIFTDRKIKANIFAERWNQGYKWRTLMKLLYIRKSLLLCVPQPT